MPWPGTPPLLAACYAASLWGRIVAGPRAGQRVLRPGRRDDQGEWGGSEEATTRVALPLKTASGAPG